MRALRILVIGMGILIVLGLILVAYGLVSRQSAEVRRASGFGEVTLPLPAGCDIAEAHARDDRLIVRVGGPAERGCQEVFVIDMANGKVLGRVRVESPR